MNLAAMRPGNRRAFELTMERLRRGEQTTSLVKPTRYGKRDVIITIAFQAVTDGIVGGALVFSPAAQATRQFFKEKKLLETIARYDLPARRVLDGVRQLRSFDEYQPFSNGEFLLALNIQLCLRTNIQDCLDLIDTERKRTGLPLVIFIDECQFVAEKKRWGDFFRRVQAAGALLVLLTATPYREDADAIPGFRTELLKEHDERRWITTDAGDGENNRIDIWDGSRAVTVLHADDTTTFGEAWDEVPLPLCRLDREAVRVEIEGSALKDLSAAQTKRHLARIVRSRQFLDPALRLVLSKLALTQLVDPRCKAMIVTGNDRPNDQRDNAHAETIRELIAELSPAILGRAAKVRIITLKTLEDDSAAVEMEAFFESDDDIVIVKQIGTVGLDDGRLKTLGYFSPIRSVAAMIQTWMRPATPYGGLTIGHLVMPEDRFSLSVWKKLIEEEGGEARLAEMSGWSPEQWVKSFLSPKGEEGPETSDEEFGPGLLGGYDDSQGNIGSLEWHEHVTRLFERFPKIALNYTKAEFAVALAEQGTFFPGTAPTAPVWGIEKQLEVLYEQIETDARDKAKAWMDGIGSYDKTVYGHLKAKVYWIAYRQVGMPLHMSLRQIKNVETLRRIDRAILALPWAPPDV